MRNVSPRELKHVQKKVLQEERRKTPSVETITKPDVTPVEKLKKLREVGHLKENAHKIRINVH